jgi:hypothetical protein
MKKQFAVIIEDKKRESHWFDVIASTAVAAAIKAKNLFGKEEDVKKLFKNKNNGLT